MTIRHDGNIGIWTQNPSVKLDVLGDVKIGWQVQPSADFMNAWSLQLNTVWLTNQTAYYTNYVSLGRWTYLAYFYNCLASASSNYYLTALSEWADYNGGINWDFSQNKAYHNIPFVFKVNADSRSIRFKVQHSSGGTINDTYTSGSPWTCSSFIYVRIWF